ncbi:MAG: cytochrome c oxidase subunit 3 [Chitinophagaceae bacterium]|nr:cytochrome c oxidase subunit 3 [Oligoflexus sp.]
MATTQATVSGPLGHSKKGIPSPVLGILIFVVGELMFFSALVSTRIVIKASAGIFAPPQNVKLPVLTTGFNTIVLLLSGIFMAAAGFKHGSERSKSLFAMAIATGVFFLGVQGYEWFNLLHYGMTMTSSVFGATFYLLIGCHALHVILAVLTMLWFYRLYSKDKFGPDGMLALQIYWSFVVLIWPVLYSLVYF